ncbi:hypothetical protein O3P69_010405 [Scylla paramamosain]|uniref:Uncharacterized protein n=1 Tax=Scylla paramamosain TaxID=85552 RepID=A0AAW0TVT2_SCYPA
MSSALALAAASSCAIEKNLSNFEFFEKYMRSDEYLAPSNKLSGAYNVPYEVLPNNTIKVLRRIEWYINREIDLMTKLCMSTITNYTRRFVLSYMIKLVLKLTKKKAAAAAAASINDSIMIFPASYLTPVDRIPSGTREIRDGPIAEWFAINMSLLLGRKIDPQYTLLLLVNWALTSTEQELLKRVINTFNIFFHHASGLAVPNIGFGVGMTRRRLKAFAQRLITQFVAPLVVQGSRRNTPRSKTSQDGRGRQDPVVLVGLTFEPSEARREIYEEEYNKMLMSQPHLLAEFGVCGLLTASSDKTLVMLKLLKELLIYTQREVAVAIGWSRLLQFFFKKVLADLYLREGQLPRLRTVGQWRRNISAHDRGGH